jgi:hyperosmotically inducible periplasmic protein
MNVKPLLACLLATSLALSALSVAAESDADSAHPAQFVKDSAITAAVKTKLAANRLGTLTSLKVDTDQNGTVWLSGTAPTQEAADRAVEIARTTEGVTQVKSDIVVAPNAN